MVTQPGLEASCTANGKTEGSYCSRCGLQLKAQTTISARHSFGSWTEITAATAETDGLAQRTCSKCGYKEERVLSKDAPELPTEEATAPESTPTVTTPTEQPPLQSDTTLPEISDPTTPPTQPDTGKKNPVFWVVAGIIGIALIADAVVSIIYFKKKKQKK